MQALKSDVGSDVATADLEEAAFDVPRRTSGRTLDDRASLIGAAIGSLALVWVLFERVFALSGAVGFIVCWYLAFVALYAIVSAVSNPGPIVVDRVWAAVVTGGASLVGLALAATIVFIFVKGWPALHHLNFYTHDMAGVRPTSPLTQGGVLHAVVGTVIQIAIAVAIALPLGVATAVYMTEV
ncbi:MAG: phosphate ABC transporter, permease protein PstA, partial [Acidimicrobiia bacterium]|nr:phosphate ABC transporter, permease protein PstA [Acidimicrobiia bacterium]